MTPKRAITVYITLPCLLYGVFFVLALTRYSGTIERDMLYAAHTVFGGTSLLLSIQNETNWPRSEHSSATSRFRQEYI